METHQAQTLELEPSASLLGERNDTRDKRAAAQAGEPFRLRERA